MKFIHACIAILILFATSGCKLINLPTVNGVTGSLTVSISNRIAKDLVPDINMEPASYTVTGNGPGGATFSVTVSGSTTASINQLRVGSWSITVEAKNSSDSLIGIGTTSTTITAGVAVSVSVVVKPYAGLGSLDFVVTWPEGVISPTVEACLTSTSDGSVRPLSFAISSHSASCSASDIPTGYYTMSLVLKSEGVKVAGCAQTARIVRNQITSGTIVIDKVTTPSGHLYATVSLDMQEPIVMTISGGATSKYVTELMSMSVSVTNYAGDVTYTWYLNGEKVATGPSFSLKPNYSTGYYRIDVVAIGSGGGRAGSATTYVQNLPAEPMTVGLQCSNSSISALEPGTISATCDPVAEDFYWYLDGMYLDGEKSGSITIGYGLTPGQHEIKLLARQKKAEGIGVIKFQVKDSVAVNLAKGKELSSSTLFTNPSLMTDGISDVATAIATAGAGFHWVELDLGAVYNIECIALWHYFGDSRMYHDVIVSLWSDSHNQSIVFNNDTDNSAGFGVGNDSEYAESSAGKFITLAAPVPARYVRVYSNGNTTNKGNHYAEIKVFSSSRNNLGVGTASICTWRGDRQAAYTPTYDDGLVASLGKLGAAQAKYGIFGTMSIIVRDTTDWQKYRGLLNLGVFDVVSHSKNHINLTTLSASDIDENIKDSISAIEGNTGNPCKGIFYPNCASNAIVEAEAAKYFIAARGGGGRVCSSWIDDFYNIVAYGVYTATTVDELNRALDQAILSGGWLIPMGHGVDGEGSEPSPLTVYEGHFAYVASKIGSIWNSGFATVALYAKERQQTAISVTMSSEEVYTITFSQDPALQQLTDQMPLTIKLDVPSGWKSVSINQGASSSSGPVVKLASGTYAYIDAVPNAGDVLVSRIE